MTLLPDLNELSLPDLFRHLAGDDSIARLVDLAHVEDLGRPPHEGDITSIAWQSNARNIAAPLRTREPGIVSGLAVAPMLIERFAPNATLDAHLADADRVAPGDTLATLTGPADQILALERTLLNVLGRLCGIATLADRYAQRIAHTTARVFDTRKTTPGWRALEKYAVRCGGGYSHRIGLHDAVLIKDNHLAQIPTERLAQHLEASIRRARDDRPLRFVEVEADSIGQLEVILSVPPGLIDIVLLDNMASDELRRAVALRNERAPNVELDASGGITLDTIALIAETGVERISVGAMTHSARSLDVGLDVEP